MDRKSNREQDKAKASTAQPFQQFISAPRAAEITIDNFLTRYLLESTGLYQDLFRLEIVLFESYLCSCGWRNRVGTESKRRHIRFL
jgi:hypothetical protein